MITLLISACLMNQPVRYNGQAKPIHDPRLLRWQAEGRLRPICPEITAGLPTPRAPAEIQGGNGADVLRAKARVLDNSGRDLSDLFCRGAEQTLAFAQRHQVKIAILCEKSPSCGSGQIYSGEFNGQLLSGMGVTTALLKAHQIHVFNQDQLDEAAALLQQLEHANARRGSAQDSENEKSEE